MVKLCFLMLIHSKYVRLVLFHIPSPKKKIYINDVIYR